jgi:hypothetical protein
MSRFRRRPGGSRRPTYGAVRDALVALWEASDRICGKRLKVMISTLLPSLEQHGRLNLDQATKRWCSASAQPRLIASWTHQNCRGRR